MSIIFENGYSISKPSTSVTMRSLLSAAGQTTYDAATVGNFFSCSLADYNAVFAGYADAQKIGNTDVIFNTDGGTAWTGTCASVLPVENSTISANTYIIGFATKMWGNSSGTTVTPLISTTYKGTYTAISNSPTIGGTTRVYYLRKDSPLVSATSYVGHVVSANSMQLATTSYTNAGYDCASPYSLWTNRSAQMPMFQMFVTTTKPY